MLWTSHKLHGHIEIEVIGSFFSLSICFWIYLNNACSCYFAYGQHAYTVIHSLVVHMQLNVDEVWFRKTFLSVGLPCALLLVIFNNSPQYSKCNATANQGKGTPQTYNKSNSGQDFGIWSIGHSYIHLKNTLFVSCSPCNNIILFPALLIIYYDQGRPQAGSRGCIYTPWILLFSLLQNAIHAQSLTQRLFFYRVKYDSRCWCPTSRH